MNLDMSRFMTKSVDPAPNKQEVTPEPSAESQEFNGFLQELNAFAKSYGAVGQQASVKHGEGVDTPSDRPVEASDVANGEGEHEEEEEVETLNGKKPKRQMSADKMAKSVVAEVDGEQVEALEMNPDDFLKAVDAQVAKTVSATMAKALGPNQKMNNEGLSLMVKGLQVMSKQVKTFDERLTAIEQDGFHKPAMRKSAINLHERTITGQSPTPSAEDLVAEGRELMIKAVNPAFGLIKKGVLQPLEISIGEKFLNQEMPLPKEIHQKIAQAVASQQ